jgi:hypothetical protein
MRTERVWQAHPSAVRRAVQLARARGQLVAVEPLPAPCGQAAVRVVLRTQALPTPPRRTHYWWAAGALVFVAAAGGVGWVMWWAASWAAAHSAQIGRVVLGAAVVVVGGWWLLGRIGACPGIHCPGCRHG